MTDTVENLILEHLKNLHSEVATLHSNMQDEFEDLKQRLSQVEMQVTGTRRNGIGKAFP